MPRALIPDELSRECPIVSQYDEIKGKINNIVSLSTIPHINFSLLRVICGVMAESHPTQVVYVFLISHPSRVWGPV